MPDSLRRRVRPLLLSILIAALSAPVANAEILFSSNLEATLTQAREDGMPVMLAFHAVWCPNCRRMAEFTIPSPEVQAFAERFLWVRIDIDRNVTIAREYDVYATPHFYLLDSEGRRRRRIVGTKGPAEFASLLDQFLSDLGVEAEAQDLELQEDAEVGPATELSWTPKGYRGLAICFSHVGYGPLSLKTQSPFQSLRLGLTPRTPSTLAKGQVEWNVSGTWANIWSVENEDFGGVVADVGSYFLDYETLMTSAVVAYGVTDHLQVDLELENQRRFGGAMDSLIQGFHDMFGIGQAGRKDVAKNDFTYLLTPPGGQPAVALDRGDRGSFSSNALFSIQHNVTCGTARYPAFAYAVTGRWTASNDDLQGGDFDYGISVATSRRFKNFYGYLTLGHAWFGSDRFRGIQLRETQFSSLAVFEWRRRPKTSWLVHALVTEGVAEGFDPFSKPSYEITFGWKREIVPLGVLEIGFVENIKTIETSADFSIHAGYTRRY